MHFLAYLKFMDNYQLAIDIVSTVTWQSILLSYSLISATTPLLKGFTQGFMTAGIALGYSREGTTVGSSGTSGSYQLRSLTRPKAKSNMPKSMLRDVIKPREHESLVLGNTKQTSIGYKTSQEDYESASIMSHDSRQIMIRRECKVTVD